MHCKRNPGKGSRIRWIRGVGRGMVLLMAGMLAFTWGCSGGEDQEPPKKKNKVVVAIKRPMPKLGPEENVAPVPATSQEPKKTAVVKAKTVRREEQGNVQQEQPKPEEIARERPVPAEAPAEALKNPERPKLERGFVRVREGESLSAIAARGDVYGDFLKWPELYRLNVKHLGMIRTWEDVKKKPLPAGTSLRYIHPAEEKKAQSPFQSKPWVVTVRSWQTPGRLAAPAIKLIQNGYNVYIARAVVKDKPWLRLRVGFYRSKSDAMAAKKKIGEILGNNDAWIARVGKTELEKFSGD